MIRILIADDHPLVREGLHKVLEREPDMEIVGEASNGRETVERATRADVDVVVLDISMPDQSGLDVLKELRRRDVRLRVLILSMHSEDQYGIRALRACADGYITKESAPEVLIAAIRKVHAGGKYVSPSLAERLASWIKPSGKLPYDSLSDRELEVFLLIASGKTVSTIAQKLSLSVSTINTHRARILEKLGMKTNAELTRHAITQGLIG